MRTRIPVLIGLFVLCSGSSGGGGCGADELSGDPTGSVCPTNSTVTYETFGNAFFDQYCTSCHAEALRGDARNGAPSDHNFDTLELVREVSPEHIDSLAAAGPNAVNTIMPPPEEDGPKPSDDERRLLGEWLACGMP